MLSSYRSTTPYPGLNTFNESFYRSASPWTGCTCVYRWLVHVGVLFLRRFGDTESAVFFRQRRARILRVVTLQSIEWDWGINDDGAAVTTAAFLQQWSVTTTTTCILASQGQRANIKSFKSRVSHKRPLLLGFAAAVT